MTFDNIKLQTTWNDAAGSINANFLKVLQAFQSVEGGLYVMYHHVQTKPSTVWTINHGMSKYPNVKILDSSKQLCMADVYYVDENTVRIEFGSTQSGSAYLD